MPSDKITSFRNEHVKRALELRDRKTRDKSNLTIVEGWREVARAQEARADFKTIFLCRELSADRADEKLIKQIAGSKTELWETTPEIFAKLSFGDRQEGILAVVAPSRLKLEDLKLNKAPLIVVAERLEKPGNLGAILRTCDGAGVDALIVCDGATDLYNPNVIRASLGTVFSVPVVQNSSEAALKFLKGRGIRICAMSPRAKTIYTGADLKGPTAVAVGSEEEGLTELWMEQADIKVNIPMRGRADSLNVSTTAAIVIYEALRQRQ